MNANDTRKTAPDCPSCGRTMRFENVTIPMWLGADLNLIEDVPAHVCDACDLQHLDSETEAAIRRVVASGFPEFRARRQISAAVFGLRDFDGAAPSREAAE